MLPDYPNILLVSGSGRNVGKTTFSTSLIAAFAHQKPVAVKVSPHWHPVSSDDPLLYIPDNLLLIKEQNRTGTKDTSRMLRSGASEVYYVQTIRDDYLMQAFHRIMQPGMETKPIIVESAALGDYIRPAVHFHIDRPGHDVDPSKNRNIQPDYRINFNGQSFDFDIKRIQWNDHRWVIH